MKINNFKINGFGKLSNTEVEFQNGINIVYGENEAGKSSMLKFISGMLYGISKNKNGKEISDLERFTPWKISDFSGKINYTLDNEENFEVYREFKKKNPVIYNSYKEDISKNFSIDKTKGIDFFTEQTGIDEETFYNTAIIEQENIKLNKSSQNSILQKISNLISSGDDSISFKKSNDKITKRQNEEVGSERTSQRPINVLENRIYKLLEEKKNLEIYKENMYDNSIEKEQLFLEDKDIELKKTVLKEIKNKLDNNRVKNAEINFNKNLETEYEEKINQLNEKINSNYIDSGVEKIDTKNYNILLIIFICSFLGLMVFTKYKIQSLILLLPIFFIAYLKFKKHNLNVQNEMQRNMGKEKVISELELLKQSKTKQEQDTLEKQKKFDEEVEKEKQDLINKYIEYLDIGFLEDALNRTYDDVLKEIDKLDNRQNTVRFRIHTMEATTEEINKKLENLSKIEEAIEEAEEEKEELLSLNNSYNIAKVCLERAYEQVKENISPRFTENLCDIISKISNNKYNNIAFSDVNGLSVEVENGNYVPASRLSTGTIDQMYLSLRLSALNEISNETMPIILDEVFAYFDEERMKNMLKYLNVNFKNNQIIIFTCSKREEKVLKDLNINYNLIKI